MNWSYRWVGEAEGKLEESVIKNGCKKVSFRSAGTPENFLFTMVKVKLEYLGFSLSQFTSSSCGTNLSEWDN